MRRYCSWAFAMSDKMISEFDCRMDVAQYMIITQFYSSI